MRKLHGVASANDCAMAQARAQVEAYYNWNVDKTGGEAAAVRHLVEV